jgi:hypothetical protein
MKHLGPPGGPLEGRYVYSDLRGLGRGKGNLVVNRNELPALLERLPDETVGKRPAPSSMRQRSGRCRGHERRDLE